MGSKALFLVVACFLLIKTEVSAIATTPSEDLKKSPPPNYPTPPPLVVSTPPPIYKAPPTPPSPLVASPPPPTYKSPTTPSPLVASPPPPVYKAPPPPTPPRNTKECFPLCVIRCKNHSRQNVCLRACVTCCDRCKCVPPGQYGNKEKCGDGKCYAQMTTHGGLPKCP